jgi:hypothetical protein
MENRFIAFLHRLGAPFKRIFSAIYLFIKGSRLAKILLIIVIVKMLIFHGLFQSFLFPKYFKPKYDSEKQQIDDVVKHIVPEPKNNSL